MPAGDPGSIASGSLRRPVQIVVRNDIADGRGGSTETWTPLQSASIFADIAGSGGAVVTQFAAVDSRVSSVITIRWRRGITPDMRVQETVYDINGNATGVRQFVVYSVVDPDNTHRILLLACEELQASGTAGVPS